MAGIENKFIFTNEGRCSLISQLNGIRFAILGAILVSPVCMNKIVEHLRPESFYKPAHRYVYVPD